MQDRDTCSYDGPTGMTATESGGTSTGTGVLERTQTRRQKSPGDNERYAHYVRKDRVTQSLLTGRPVVALCGKIWVPQGDPRGVPVCPKCKEIVSHMGSHGDYWPFGSPQK